jgi:adenosylcobinamide-phosphate synthase
VVEAAFAGALGVRLGGTNRYGDRVEHRAVLGRGRAARPDDIRAATRVAARVGWGACLVGAAVALGLGREWRPRWARSPDRPRLRA